MKISSPTVVRGPNGERVRIAAGKVPDQYADQITNPAIIVTDEAEADAAADAALRDTLSAEAERLGIVGYAALSLVELEEAVSTAQAGEIAAEAPEAPDEAPAAAEAAEAGEEAPAAAEAAEAGEEAAEAAPEPSQITDEARAYAEARSRDQLDEEANEAGLDTSGLATKADVAQALIDQGATS